MKIRITEIATGEVSEYPLNDSNMHFCANLSPELYTIALITV